MKKGFTLLEVMIAITILTIAIGGSFALIQQNLISSSINQTSLTAYYLAQEGLEIVKNIRDNNWLAERDWNYGLSDNDYQADYKSTELNSYQDQYLKIGADGFYNYSLGSLTNFKRKITIKNLGEDKLKATVLVDWTERGRTHEAEITEYLYNWYGYEGLASQSCYLEGEPQTCEGADATALGCYAGDEGCRLCDNGECTFYTSGQHYCSVGQCNGSGYCEEEFINVCLGKANGEQPIGCDGTCQICQNEVCVFAEAGTDPGGDCTGEYSCSGFITRTRNMCGNFGICADIDIAASDCAGTCSSYCNGGVCVGADTGEGTCVISTNERVESGGDGACAEGICISDNWGLDYNHRKQFTVNGADEEQSNYQLKLVVYKGGGTDSGDKVYLNDNSLNWPNDIRFTKSDGISELDYWIESTNEDSSTIWLEFDLVPASANTDFYIYYGNTLATSASNRYNVFPYPLNFSFENYTPDTEPRNRPDDWGYVDGVSERVTVGGSNPLVHETKIIALWWINNKGRAGNTASVSQQVDLTNIGLLSLNLVSQASDTTYHSYARSDLKVYIDNNFIINFGHPSAPGQIAYKEVAISGYSGMHTLKLQWQQISADNMSSAGLDFVTLRNYVSSGPTFGSWGIEE